MHLCNAGFLECRVFINGPTASECHRGCSSSTGVAVAVAVLDQGCTNVPKNLEAASNF